ncbi:MAG: tetratricopeptide repeat protein, partial [Magnetococcales bacterium]|nr:tetratricopeptide repeat protein [Magnetococcales bacterium]
MKPFVMRQLISVMALGLWLGFVSSGHALQSDPCPVAQEVARKGLELFELHPDRSIKALEQAWQKCPSHAGIGYDLGLALFLTKQPEKARDVWRLVLEGHPGHRNTLTNLAWTYFELGDDETAIKLAMQGLKQYPGDLALIHTQLFALFRVGQYVDAYDLLYRAKLEGMRPRAWRDQAAGYVVEHLWHQFRRGEPMEAVRQSVNLLAREYPDEPRFSEAKNLMVAAAVDRDAEIPYET